MLIIRLLIQFTDHTGTFDVRNVSVHGSVVNGQICLNITYVQGSETHECFILFNNTGREFNINGTFGCIPNVPPGTHDIIATDADAKKQIHIAAPVTIQIVVPNYTPSVSPTSAGESVQIILIDIPYN